MLESCIDNLVNLARSICFLDSLGVLLTNLYYFVLNVALMLCLFGFKFQPKLEVLFQRNV